MTCRSLFEDTAEEGRFIETVYVDSWLTHLRQRERVTEAHRLLQETIRFHVGTCPPHVTHLLVATVPVAVTHKLTWFRDP